MLIPVLEIQVKEGRRELNTEHVRELADSIRELGLLNPITIDKEHALIAGLHRLEAVKLLEWPEVECTVSSLEGLQAELAEIDENFVRNDISALEYGDMLLRRKEIYETLHPETKARNLPGHVSNFKSSSEKSSLEDLSFVQDTAKKLGVVPRTVEVQIQTAKNLTPEAKEIIKDSDAKITKKSGVEALTPGTRTAKGSRHTFSRERNQVRGRVQTGRASGTRAGIGGGWCAGGRTRGRRPRR